MQRTARFLLFQALALISFAAAAVGDDLGRDIVDLQHAWEHVHYQVPEKQQDTAFADVDAMADKLVKRYPGRAEPLVWKAIVLSTHAGARGGLGALGMVRDARDLLERAEKIDPSSLNGSIYTTLGSLYYQVPGWPLGYGDDTKAEAYLKKALTLNPDGVDPNYFYGDFLYRKGDYTGAMSALQKALRAPPRPERPLADAGRRKEIQAIIDKINAKS